MSKNGKANCRLPGELIIVHQAARFLNISHLAPDETLMGYLLRLAEDNGYAGCKEIGALLGLRLEGIEGHLFSGCLQPDLASLAQATGYEEARLRQSCYQEDEQWVTFGEARLPARYIKFKYPKFCPACLAESPHHRWSWDLAHVTVCLKHQLLLMDRCPACRKRVYWDRASLMTCACGCDWTQMKGQVIEATELFVSQQVLAFCGFGQQRKENVFLDNLDFEAFLDTTFFAAALYLLSQKNWTLTLKKQNHIFHAGLTATCTLLADPPQSFFAFLDNLYPDERKRILPMCRDYLGHSVVPLTAWVAEYVEGYPNRRQLRLVFGNGIW